MKAVIVNDRELFDYVLSYLKRFKMRYIDLKYSDNAGKAIKELCIGRKTEIVFIKYSRTEKALIDLVSSAMKIKADLYLIVETAGQKWSILEKMKALKRDNIMILATPFEIITRIIGKSGSI